MSENNNIRVNQGERPEAVDEIRQNVEAKIAERLNSDGRDVSTMDVTEAATIVTPSEADPSATRFGSDDNPDRPGSVNEEGRDTPTP